MDDALTDQLTDAWWRSYRRAMKQLPSYLSADSRTRAAAAIADKALSLWTPPTEDK